MTYQDTQKIARIRNFKWVDSGDEYPIVSAEAVVEVNGEMHVVRVDQAIYVPDAPRSILSEYQMRDYGVGVDSVPRHHGGTQTITAAGLKIPLGVHKCLPYMKIRNLGEDGLVGKIKKPTIFLTGMTLWRPDRTGHSATTALSPILQEEQFFSGNRQQNMETYEPRVLFPGRVRSSKRRTDLIGLRIGPMEERIPEYETNIAFNRAKGRAFVGEDSNLSQGPEFTLKNVFIPKESSFGDVDTLTKSEESFQEDRKMPARKRERDPKGAQADSKDPNGSLSE